MTFAVKPPPRFAFCPRSRTRTVIASIPAVLGHDTVGASPVPLRATLLTKGNGAKVLGIEGVRSVFAVVVSAPFEKPRLHEPLDTWSPVSALLPTKKLGFTVKFSGIRFLV